MVVIEAIVLQLVESEAFVFHLCFTPAAVLEDVFSIPHLHHEVHYFMEAKIIQVLLFLTYFHEPCEIKAFGS